MSKQLNGTLRLRTEGGNHQKFRASFYTDSEVGGSLVVTSVPTDLSSLSVGLSFAVPNSDGTTFTTYVVSLKEDGTKILLKDEGTTTQVIDNLTSTSTSAALSAKQGKVLKDNQTQISTKVSSIETEIGDINTILTNI